MLEPRFQELADLVSAHPPVSVAVAYPCSVPAIKAALMAGQAGIVRPILVGHEKRIRTLAEDNGLELGDCLLHDVQDDPLQAAWAAVELCRRGEAGMLAKGSLHSDELLSAVIRREAGLRTERRISHAFVFEVPGSSKWLLMADCVVNIAPNLMEKRDIIQNAVDLARRLSISRPSVAVLSAMEMVNPAIPSTIEAAALSKMAERGQITGAIVDGPLAFDVAASSEAAAIKGLARPGGDPDIFIVPNIEAGNMLYKQFVHITGAECAGLVLGAQVPIVLTSRADSLTTRIASYALAGMMAQ
ncbi:MAG TPA: bifunctional enoyl-CoA hydratase/phosphate acetyltransferase [Candidatus Sulfotelmatobacter sp.]|jgi:phosphate acetyltransferase|nr:bifunctional enoyl-CoA hydratase/phosphate acetyltransferase [Candidatus Sulfotelmatobacter sp.]